MKSQVLHTVWRSVSGEAAGEIWHWSLLGVKGLRDFISNDDQVLASAIWLQAMNSALQSIVLCPPLSPSPRPPPPPPLGTPAQYSLPPPVSQFAHLHSVQEGRRDRGDVVRGGNKQDLRTGREWYDPLLNRALLRTTTPQPSHQIKGG